MKELELTMRLRNNLLKRRRTALGISAPELSRRIGVSYNSYIAYEGLRRDPIYRRRRSDADGNPSRELTWKPSALRIAEYFGSEPAELWPDVILAVRKPAVVSEMDAEETRALLSLAARLELPPTPEALLEQREISQGLSEMMLELAPRERKLIKRRFADGATLRSAGEAIGVSTERARQIERRALRRLREKLQKAEL